MSFVEVKFKKIFRSKRRARSVVGHTLFWPKFTEAAKDLIGFLRESVWQKYSYNRGAANRPILRPKKRTE